jgi:hypothetical protein
MRGDLKGAKEQAAALKKIDEKLSKELEALCSGNK